MRAALLLALALTALALPASAQACRVNIPGEDRIAAAYEQGFLDAVVLVRVTDTDDKKFQGGQYVERTTRARTIRTLSGDDAPTRIEFLAYGPNVVSSCNWPPPLLPEVGDELVLYLATNGAGNQYTWLVLTLDDAKKYDRRLASALELGEVSNYSDALKLRVAAG